MRKHISIALTAVAVLSIAACSSTKSTTDAPTPTATATSTDSMTTTADAPFGPGCAAVPTDPSNTGSFDSMSKVPVATAASGNPILSTLVTAVTAAGLGDTLNNAPALTVFAPANSAFEKIPAKDLAALLADKTALTKILTYHVISGKISPDQLAGTHKTLEGEDLTVTGSGTSFMVNGNATVVCGNVQTSNATVYIIDTVLMPKG